MLKLKQSTAVVIPFGPFVDKADGNTLETGLVSALDNGTTGIKLAKNGGALTIRHATVTASTYDSYGNYLVTLDATDTNTLGHLRVQYADNNTTALPYYQDYEIVPVSVWDSFYNDTGPVPHLGIIDRGTAQSATGTTLVLRSAATFADDTPVGATLAVYGSTQGYWQTRTIVDYVLSTDTATVDTWTVTPSGTITYVLFVGAPASTTLPPTFALADGGITAAKFASGAIDAAALATDAVTEIADGLLNRDMSVGTDSGSTTVRTVRQALRALRNKWSVTAGTVTVTKEDDSTASWTGAVTGTPAVTVVDPAGP